MLIAEERGFDSMSKSGSRFTKRARTVFLLGATSLVLLLAPGFSKSGAAQQPEVAVDAGATAHVFTAKEIHRQFEQIAKGPITAGGGGGKLGDYGSNTIGLSFRSASGGAEIHQHFNDILFVRRGKATLCTGGTVVDGKTISEGEIKGASIQGGTRQEITEGDVIHIPAGTPHQILLQPGTALHILVIKVRQ